MKTKFHLDYEEIAGHFLKCHIQEKLRSNLFINPDFLWYQEPSQHNHKVHVLINIMYFSRFCPNISNKSFSQFVFHTFYNLLQYLCFIFLCAFLSALWYVGRSINTTTINAPRTPSQDPLPITTAPFASTVLANSAFFS